MHRKTPERVGRILLALALLLSLAACQGGQWDSARTVEVYYAVSAVDPSAGNARVARPVKAVLPDEADSIRFAFESMLLPPQDDTLHSAFPAGTELLSVSVEEGCAVVGLSGAWVKATGLNKTVAEYCLLKTALQFEGVTSARWELRQAEGEAAAATGTVLREENYVDTPLELVPARHEIKLYFSAAEGDRLVPETRTVVLRENESAEWYRLVVDGLITGPVTSGASPVMPERTRLVTVTMDNRVCIVNLSREFVGNATGEPQRARMTLLALVNSLTELQGVGYVKIHVEGEELPSYFGWDTSKPLERDDPSLTA